MSDNKAAVLYAARDVRLEPWPVPARLAGQVLIAVEAVGICGSDVHYFEHGRMLNLAVERPLVLGHEVAGRVIDPGASKLAAGTLVAIEPQVTCGHCQACWGGHYNLCPEVRFMATPPVHGALTRQIVVPAEFCFPVPAHVTAPEAALAEPLAVGLWAGIKTRVSAGDRVLVVGAGPVGILAAQVARSLGATEIVVIDTNPVRAAFAGTFGRITGQAVQSDDDWAGLGCFDVLVECSGAPGALDQGLAVLARLGRAAIVGIGLSRRAEIDLMQIQERELELVGVFRYAGIYRRAVELLASGAVEVGRLITHRYGLDQAAQALSIARHDPAAVKAVVFPQLDRME
jgi:L-iditol 2-dehydrogenase